MSGLKGDFIGFTFNGIHSSELGITRTSEGSRYSEDLLPSIEDKIVRVPGGHGNYYFGSYYTTKNFNISIAFDNLSELQFRRLRQHFSANQTGDLIFDESPYKKYIVKPISTPNLKYICFEGESEERIYKGEGNIILSTINSPFARSCFKQLSDFSVVVDSVEDTDIDIPDIYKIEQKTVADNKKEWAAASGIKETLDGFDTYANSKIQVFNPGDLETDFILQLSPLASNTTLTLQLGNNSELIIKNFSLLGNDVKFQINSKTELIEGLDEKGNLTGNIYNKYITGGKFFKIPVTDEEGMALDLIEGLTNVKIIYDYLYF